MTRVYPAAIDVSPLNLSSSSGRGIGTYLRGILSGFAELEVEIEHWSPDLRLPEWPLRLREDLRVRWMRLALTAPRSSRLLHLTSPASAGAEVRQRHGFVATVYDLIPLRFQSEYLPRLDHRLIYQLYLRQLRQASHLIAISSAVRDDLVDLVGRDPSAITVVPLGVPTLPEPEVTADSRARPFVHFCGTPDPHKNLRFAIRVVAAIPAASRPVLTVTGGPDERMVPLQEEARRCGVDVRHLGMVSEQELSNLYAGAEAVLFPSRYEGFGLPGYEALALGARVIASDGGALVDLAAFGATVLPLDVDLWRDELTRQDRLGAIPTAPLPSWRAAAESTLGVYDEVRCVP